MAISADSFGNALGNSIVGQIEQTAAEQQTAQINQQLAVQSQADSATVNQATAQSTQAFNDQVSASFNGQESLNLQAASAEQNLLSSTEAGFSTPAITGLGNVPINIEQPQASAIAGAGGSTADNAANAILQVGTLNDQQSYDLRTEAGRLGALKQAQAAYTDASSRGDAQGQAQASSVIDSLQQKIDYSQPRLSVYDPAQQQAILDQRGAAFLQLTTPFPSIGYYGAEAIGANPVQGAQFGAAVGQVFLGSGAALAVIEPTSFNPTSGLSPSELADLQLFQSASAAPASGPVKFGQIGVSSNFSAGSPFAAAPVASVASLILENQLAADDIQINVIRFNGEYVTVNNRSLTALSEAGQTPTNIVDITDSINLDPRAPDNVFAVIQQLRELNFVPSSTITVRSPRSYTSSPYVVRIPAPTQ